MTRGPWGLPLPNSFEGSGVYALFYHGEYEPYQFISESIHRRPIYVGKAVPPGGRKGKTHKTRDAALFKRLKEHATSISKASNLDVRDFRAPFIVVTPLWITMAERFLIEHFQPVWNVCLEGFGNHDPGSGRHKGINSWWDTLHPGREWAKKLQSTRNPKEALERLEEHWKQDFQPPFDL